MSASLPAPGPPSLGDGRWAVVCLEDAWLRRWVVEALTRSGRTVRMAQDRVALLALTAALPVELVVAGATFGGGGSCTVADVREIRPGCRVLVIHEDHSQPAALWETFRHGGLPCPGAELSLLRELLEGGTIIADPRVCARRAMQHEAAGRGTAACITMSLLDTTADLDDAADELVRIGSAVVGHLQARSQFPIDLDRIVAGADGVDRHQGLWWSALQRVVFGAAGLELADLERQLGVHARPRTWATFDVTSVLLRFTARRHWSSPDRLLQVLTGRLPGSPLLQHRVRGGEVLR